MGYNMSILKISLQEKSIKSDVLITQLESFIEKEFPNVKMEVSYSVNKKRPFCFSKSYNVVIVYKGKTNSLITTEVDIVVSKVKFLLTNKKH